MFLYLDCDDVVYQNSEDLQSANNFNANFSFENSNALSDLMDSIRNIAKSFEQPLKYDFMNELKSPYSSATLPPCSKPVNLLEGKSSLKPKIEQKQTISPVQKQLKIKNRESSVQPILNRITMLAKGVTESQQTIRRDHSAQPLSRQRENDSETKNWSNSFFKAANFIADKLNNTVNINEAQEKKCNPLDASWKQLDGKKPNSSETKENFERVKEMPNLKREDLTILHALNPNSTQFNYNSENGILANRKDFKPFLLESNQHTQINENQIINTFDTNNQKDLLPQARFYRHPPEINVFEAIEDQRKSREKFKRRSLKSNKNNCDASALPPLLPNKLNQLNLDGLIEVNSLTNRMKKSTSMNGELKIVLISKD